MSRRIQIYVLVGLLLLLVTVYLYNRTDDSSIPGVLASDVAFQPLNVSEPHLRLDLLAKLQKLEYSGSHRNIFSATALPPPAPVLTPAERARIEHRYPTVPPPPPLPPVEVPAQFFGYAAMANSGKKVAFFLNGEDVLVVEEGSVFLTRFRLDKIVRDSADVEEISTSRHTSVPMIQPPPGEQPSPNQPNQPQPNQ